METKLLPSTHHTLHIISLLRRIIMIFIAVIIKRKTVNIFDQYSVAILGIIRCAIISN